MIKALLQNPGERLDMIELPYEEGELLEDFGIVREIIGSKAIKMVSLSGFYEVSLVIAEEQPNNLPYNLTLTGIGAIHGTLLVLKTQVIHGKTIVYSVEEDERELLRKLAYSLPPIIN